jgi:transporter family-2 protein
MQNLVFIILIGLAGGVAVGLQTPLASLLSQRIGTMESVFILHLGGGLLAGLFLLAAGGGNLGAWRSVPWYMLGAGVFGVVVISAISYTIPRIGVATTVTLVVMAQLVISALLDHFGLLGVDVRVLDFQRLAGLAALMLGTWLMVR